MCMTKAVYENRSAFSIEKVILSSGKREGTEIAIKKVHVTGHSAW